MWGTDKKLELSGGVWYNFIGVPYLSGYAGVGIDHISSINSNAQKISEKLQPILKLLTPNDLITQATFDDFLKSKKQDLKSNDIKVVRQFRDDLYTLIQVMLQIADGNLKTLTDNTTGIVAELAKDIYTHKSVMDLQWGRYGGGWIDLIHFLQAPSVIGKLTALFGIIKINNYRTLISHSEDYNLSQSEYVLPQNNNVVERANNIIALFNGKFKSVFWLSAYTISTNNAWEVIFPASASVKIDGENNKELKLTSNMDVSMQVFSDRVEITTSTREAEIIEPEETINTSTTLDAANTIHLNIDANDVNIQKNVMSNSCRKIENNYPDMKTQVEMNLAQVTGKTMSFDGVSREYAYRWPLAKFGISKQTRDPMQNIEIENQLDKKTWKSEQYEKMLPRLNQRLLANYNKQDFLKLNSDKPKEDPTKFPPVYEVYRRMIRYETVLKGQFVEIAEHDKFEKWKKVLSQWDLYITNRDQKFDARIKDTTLNAWLKTTKKELTAKMKQVDYQWFGSVPTSEVTGFTRWYTDSWYNVKELKSNTFITTGEDIKNFEKAFVNVKLSDPTVLNYVKEWITQPKIDSINKSAYEAFTTRLDASPMTIDNVTTTFGAIKDKYSYELPTDVDFTTSLEVPIYTKDTTDKVGSININHSSDYYMVGNWQCAANETFVYAPQYSGSIDLAWAPTTPIVEEVTPLGYARVQVAQWVMNKAVKMRNGKLWAWFASQRGSFGPATTPGKPWEPRNPNDSTPTIHNPSSTPDIIIEEATNIPTTPTSPPTNTSAPDAWKWFPFTSDALTIPSTVWWIDPVPDPILDTWFINNGNTSFYKGISDIIVPIATMSPWFDMGSATFASRAKTSGLEAQATKELKDWEKMNIVGAVTRVTSTPSQSSTDLQTNTSRSQATITDAPTITKWTYNEALNQPFEQSDKDPILTSVDGMRIGAQIPKNIPSQDLNEIVIWAKTNRDNKVKKPTATVIPKPDNATPDLLSNSWIKEGKNKPVTPKVEVPIIVPSPGTKLETNDSRIQVYKNVLALSTVSQLIAYPSNIPFIMIDNHEYSIKSPNTGEERIMVDMTTRKVHLNLEDISNSENPVYILSIDIDADDKLRRDGAERQSTDRKNEGIIVLKIIN